MLSLEGPSIKDVTSFSDSLTSPFPMLPLLANMYNMNHHHFILHLCLPPPLEDGDVIYGWLLTLQKHHCALKNAFYEVSWVFEFLYGDQNPTILSLFTVIGL